MPGGRSSTGFMAFIWNSQSQVKGRAQGSGSKASLDGGGAAHSQDTGPPQRASCAMPLLLPLARGSLPPLPFFPLMAAPSSTQHSRPPYTPSHFCCPGGCWVLGRCCLGPPPRGLHIPPGHPSLPLGLQHLTLAPACHLTFLLEFPSALVRAEPGPGESVQLGPGPACHYWLLCPAGQQLATTMLLITVSPSQGRRPLAPPQRGCGGGWVPQVRPEVIGLPRSWCPPGVCLTSPGRQVHLPLGAFCTTWEGSFETGRLSRLAVQGKLLSPRKP